MAAALPDCCGASPTMAAGLEALLDAGIITGNMSNAAAIATENRNNAMPSSGWELPVSMQATGIVYATSFPALDAAIAEVSKYFSHHISLDQSVRDIISILRQKLQTRMTSTDGTSPVLSSDIEEALTNLSDVIACGAEDGNNSSAYELDRKFLFRVLVLGNAQLAQIIKAPVQV